MADKRKSVLDIAKKVTQSDEPPTNAEYAVMLALIIVLCIVVIRQIGTDSTTEAQTKLEVE